MKDFINIIDFSAAQLAAMLDRAIADKKLFKVGKLPASLERKTLAMVFEKPSLRTRVSFEMAMTQLGGHGIYLTQSDIGLGSREPVQDVARVLGRMCDGIMARTFSHELVEKLGKFAPCPVINGLTDYSHPCQAMADLMTVKEHFGSLAGRKLAFIGDGNNVARSLASLCSMLGMKFALACPEGYDLDQPFIDRMKSFVPNAEIAMVQEPRKAVAGADVIYTDTWVSMGQESQQQERLEDLASFQVNAALMSHAPSHAIVLHCLPAHHDMEITDEVFEKHSATIFEEAENRLHFQRSLLNLLMAEGGIK